MDTDDVLSPLMDAITGSTKALSFLVDKLDDFVPTEPAFLLRTLIRELGDSVDLLGAELKARNCFAISPQNVDTHCPGPN